MPALSRLVKTRAPINAKTTTVISRPRRKNQPTTYPPAGSLRSRPPQGLYTPPGSGLLGSFLLIELTKH